MAAWNNIEELWDTYYLVGSVGRGAPHGVLIVQPGSAATAIPEALRWAREWSKHRPYAQIWGIYAGATQWDKWMRWYYKNFESAGAHSVYVKGGSALWHPTVTLCKQDKVKGWPPRLFRVAGPVDPAGRGKWVIPRMICKDTSKRYLRALKSMVAIQGALELDETFLSAFRHGA